MRCHILANASGEDGDSPGKREGAVTRTASRPSLLPITGPRRSITDAQIVIERLQDQLGLLTLVSQQLIAEIERLLTKHTDLIGGAFVVLETLGKIH